MKKNKSFSLIKSFLPYYKKHYKTLALDLFCALLTTVCDLVLPLFVKKITNTAIEDLPSLTVQFVLTIGGIYLLLRIIDSAANYYMASIGHIMGTKIETAMRTDLFSHLMKLSHSFYDNAKVGQIMSRMTSDLFEVTEFSHHCPEEFFIAFIKIVGSFIILFATNIPLTLILFLTLPLMYLAMRKFNARMREAFRESRNQIGEINSQIEDSLLGIRVVKSFSNEKIESEKFEKGNQKFLSIKKYAYKQMASFHTVTRVFDGVMYIIMLILGSLFLINGSISVPDYTAYLLYIQMLLASIRRIVDFTEQFQLGMTGIERFRQLMDEPITITDKPDAVELDNVKGDIDIKNVFFHYAGYQNEVLGGVSIHVSAGENIALVGPSGGGKSTLCSLIPRFYELNDGDILVDGKSIHDITLASLRRNIGIVQQDVYLFSGTVFENIAYGKPGATPEEVRSAAIAAGADEFISTLPHGYDTNVGERGVKLSGGQKQRISIARVFLKDPPILILDEATSALDNESEYYIKTSLEKLSKGRTTLTIAHRLSTVRNAQTILVLTKDGVAEKGTHEELLALNGVYASLYKISLR